MKNLLLIIFFLSLLACSNKQNMNRVDYQQFINQAELAAQSDVRQFRFQGWQPLSDRFLILRSSHQHSFLIELMSSCHDLPFTNNILIKQGMNNRLQAKFDSIVVPGQFRQTCRIDKIYDLDRDLRRQLLDFAQQKEQFRSVEDNQ